MTLLFLLLLTAGSSLQLEFEKDADTCPSPDSLTPFGVCNSLVDDLRAAFGRHRFNNSDPETTQGVFRLCGETIQCLNSMGCAHSEHARVEFEETCMEFELLTARMDTCMGRVFYAVYENKFECSEQYDFLSHDLADQKAVYLEARECILHYAELECPQVSIEYLSNEENYKKLIELLTTRPADPKCRSAHYQLRKKQCIPALDDLFIKGHELSEKYRRWFPENPLLQNMLVICRRIETCNEECVYSAEDLVKNLSACGMYRFSASHFSVCAQKINSKQIDLSTYDCFEDRNDACSVFTRSPECLQRVMVEQCGPAAVDDDFEFLVGVMSRVMGC